MSEGPAQQKQSVVSTLWLLLTIALLPILFALLVPMMPELLQRLERIKVGSFEASMVSDRVAAGATSAIISERSSQEFDFELAAWAGYDARLERNQAIELFFTGETAAEDNFSEIHQALVAPMARLFACQRTAGVGYPEYLMLIDRMILVLTDRANFDGILPAVAPLHTPGGHAVAKAQSAVLVLEEAMAATERISGLLMLANQGDGNPNKAQLAGQGDAADCGAAELTAGLRRVHIAGVEENEGLIRFRDGHLSAFVATLNIVRGGGTEAALTRAARDLRLVVARNASSEGSPSAERLSPIEKFNIEWTLARAMLKARWDADTVHSHLESARLAVYCMTRAMDPAERESSSPVDLCHDFQPKGKRADDIAVHTRDLRNLFRPLVLTDIVMLSNQYTLESLYVSNEINERARKAADVLERLTEDWTGFSDDDNEQIDRLNRILANATSGVQMFKILNAKEEEALDRATCHRARRRMSLVASFWGKHEQKSRARGEIGAHESPWMLSQKFVKHIQASCKALE